jgi:hypothetical protein
MRFKAVSVAIALCLTAPALAHAATEQFKATLAGATEAPPNTTTGKGDVTATLDTGSKLFTYAVTYSGLSEPATAAHFHGPAGPGFNAPPVITITSLPSPIKGSATLTPQQIADLSAGKWYFNIHTKTHPSGEIRGQLAKVP